MSVNARTYSHYFKPVPVEVREDGSIGPVTHIDIYNVTEMWGVHQAAVVHALKKLVCAGGRGSKGYAQDIKEARDSLNRELEIEEQREVVSFLEARALEDERRRREADGTVCAIAKVSLSEDEIEAVVDAKLAAILDSEST